MTQAPARMPGLDTGEAPRDEPSRSLASAAGAPDTSAAIVVEHVSRWYGNVVAVNDISFGLSAGVTGLLGPNGAGKTTLLHLVSGLLRPSPVRHPARPGAGR